MVQPLWWQKYRPQSISSFIFQNDYHKQIISKYLDEKTFPHLLFYGVRGSGKTTLANILINELIEEDDRDSDVLYLNGSSEGNIDTMRSMVKSHIGKMPMGDMNIVFVDEADGLSPAAQNSLRGLMEKYDSKARFIFTCNYVNKLTPELRSRFTEFKFNKVKKSKMLETAASILLEEGVSLEEDEEMEVLKTYVDMFSSDLRKLINTLEASTIDKKLVQGSLQDDTLQYSLELLELLNKNDWLKARELIASNISEDELIEVYRFLYNYLDEIGKFKDELKWKKGIIIISDYMYRHAFHPDNEINFAGCLIKLSEV